MHARDLPASPFDELIGTEWLDDDPDQARARIAVRPDLLQPVGLVHGGIVSTLVESVCSRATALAVAAEGMTVMGQSIDVSFLKPTREGHIEVAARARHRGRTTWIWEAEATNSSGELCALARMTVAVRPRPS
ncbi:MAG: PaaI family thioesterase [Solirubrobacterales bacterium]